MRPANLRDPTQARSGRLTLGSCHHVLCFSCINVKRSLLHSQKCQGAAGEENRSVVPNSGLVHGKVELAHEAAVKSRWIVLFSYPDTPVRDPRNPKQQ